MLNFVVYDETPLKKQNRWHNEKAFIYRTLDYTDGIVC